MELWVANLTLFTGVLQGVLFNNSFAKLDYSIAHAACRVHRGEICLPRRT